MPKSTTSKRIALTVPEHIDTVLTEISSLTGMPKTALVIDLLEASIPAMKQTLDAIKLAQEGKRESAMGAMSSLLIDMGFTINESQREFEEFRQGKGEKQ